MELAGFSYVSDIWILTEIGEKLKLH